LKIRIAALLTAVLVLGAIAAGCGEDDSDSTATVTKAQFLKQGNAICAAGNKELDEEFEAFNEDGHLKENQQPSDAEAEEIADTILLPAVTEQLDELRELDAPEGEEEQVDEILSEAESAVEEVEDDPASIVTEANSPFTRVNKMAREYGLSVCGEE